ncbi:phenylacetic acid degradation protein PaaY [Motiliproteus sp. SC1-56]|uniref:phenylacetic acid degradation protein PaaY n=1 Tax=Motiliproteus sp. SC1-56 TaxID=2799565 RepID=UPI001A8FA002|nr:phenylacetic acid degradation protein PaaY [Motiliproteus sp. SC1-56]
MQVYRINGITPVVDPSAFVHPTAILIGDVIVGPGCYIGPAASLRGDFGRLVLEEGVNVQDTCVVHGFPGSDTVVERDGHIGHGAVLHGCRVGRNAMVGMNAVVMDGARIGAESIVGACAFVKAAFSCEPRSLVVGAPAKVLRGLSEQEVAWKASATARYQQLTRECHESMQPCEPLTAVEPGRPRLPGTDLKPKYQRDGG